MILRGDIPNGKHEMSVKRTMNIAGVKRRIEKELKIPRDLLMLKLHSRKLEDSHAVLGLTGNDVLFLNVSRRDVQPRGGMKRKISGCACRWCFTKFDATETLGDMNVIVLYEEGQGSG